MLPAFCKQRRLRRGNAFKRQMLQSAGRRGIFLWGGGKKKMGRYRERERNKTNFGLQRGKKRKRRHPPFSSLVEGIACMRRTKLS